MDQAGVGGRIIEALAADPAIDGRFQFRTFGYATGNPIPYSAYLLRKDLDEGRRHDPGKTDPAFDRMVLVGHSMGGLICKMVAVDSGHRLWRAVSDRPIDELTGEGMDIQLMRDCLIFGAHGGVRRVIYIATPHRAAGWTGARSRRSGRGWSSCLTPCVPLTVDWSRRTRPTSSASLFEKGSPSSIDELEWARRS